MVRLEVTDAEAKKLIDNHFNSYMVRLEGSSPVAIERSKIHFNSYMVRLEEPALERLLQTVPHFNSYMVRLEDQYNKEGSQAYKISIPIWCDWKPVTLACCLY